MEIKRTKISEKKEDDYSYGKGTKTTTVEKEQKLFGGVVDPDYQITKTTEEVKDSKGNLMKSTITDLNEKTLEKRSYIKEWDQNKVHKKTIYETRDAVGTLTFREEYQMDEKGQIAKYIITYLGLSDGKQHVLIKTYVDGKEDKSKQTLDGQKVPETSQNKESENPKKEGAQPQWGKWPDLNKDLEKLIDEMEEEFQKTFEKEQKEEQKKKQEAPQGKNKITLGPALLHYADKYAHYSSIGPVLGFTHLVNSNMGVTLDAGIYWHQEKGKNSYQNWTQSYDQFAVTAGVTWWPHSVPNSPFSTSVTGMAGVAEMKIKESTDGYGSSSISYSSLALHLGLEEDYRFNSLIGCGVQVAYRPTFFDQSMQHNYRISIQASYHLP